MQKLLFVLLGQLLLATPFLLAQSRLHTTVYFAHNQYQLSDSAKVLLRQSMAQLPPESMLKLAGHTDSVGSAAYNLQLAQQRNSAVQSFLVELGIPSQKIQTAVYGKQQPLAPNSTEAGKQQNRRVEIWVERAPWQRSDPFAALGTELQTFTVAGNAPIALVGKQGTRLSLPKNAFCKRNGQPVTGQIRIELREVYTKAEMLEANLHTLSDGRLLESGGMIYIAATAQGQPLKLQSGVQLEIDFGAGATQPGMGVFLGKEQDGQVNWQPQKQRADAQPQTDRAPQRGRREGRPRDSVEGRGLTVLSQEERQLEAVLLRSNRLGWINCDRFYLIENRSDLWVGVDTLYRTVVRLVFKDINSVMGSSVLNDSTLVFRGVPVGMTATLVAFGVVNGEYYFMSRELVLGHNQRENLELVKGSLAELRQAFRRLD